MNELTLASINAEEMRYYGRIFAKTCKESLVVLLSGALGIGKTTFVRGLAEEFGVKEQIGSPSFALMNVYEGARYKIFHIDAYREKALTWDELNLDDLLTEPYCCIIEWPERFSGVPDGLKKIFITIKQFDDLRIAEISSDDEKFLYELALKD
jgi:tRNA threonylcarbamoyladenosine biosynthesis protein TsaE